jgi:hypothetical protein
MMSQATVGEQALPTYPLQPREYNLFMGNDCLCIRDARFYIMSLRRSRIMNDACH